MSAHDTCEVNQYMDHNGNNIQQFQLDKEWTSIASNDIRKSYAPKNKSQREKLLLVPWYKGFHHTKNKVFASRHAGDAVTT